MTENLTIEFHPDAWDAVTLSLEALSGCYAFVNEGLVKIDGVNDTGIYVVPLTDDYEVISERRHIRAENLASIRIF